MDIKIPTKKRIWLRPITAFLTITSVLACIPYWLYFKTPVIDAASLDIFTIQHGNVDVFVPTHGVFKSAKESLLTAKVSGVVSEILIKPGQAVKAGDVIAKLENNDLLQKKEHLLNDYLKQQAAVESLKLNHQQQNLDFETAHLAIEASFAQAELDVNIYERLQKLGVSSKIELEKAKLKLELQSKNRELHQKTIEHSKSLQSFQLKQAYLQLEQNKIALDRTEREVSDLLLTAEQSGVLQNSTLEVGQRIEKGDAIAKVGSRNQLVASVSIPAHKINDINDDAEVYIEISGQKFSTQLHRIESEITQSSVVAESVTIDHDITNSLKLRPTQSFSAKIFSHTLKNKTFVDRTAGISPYSRIKVFMQKNSSFELSEIITEQVTDTAIILKSGANAGDQIVGLLPESLNYLSRHKKFNLNK